jgi:hypothetical protein
MSGFKAQYRYLALLVISEFNEWRVLLCGPAGTIHRVHQLSEEKAKEHAMAVVRFTTESKNALPDVAN